VTDLNHIHEPEERAGQFPPLDGTQPCRVSSGAIDRFVTPAERLRGMLARAPGGRLVRSHTDQPGRSCATRFAALLYCAAGIPPLLVAWAVVQHGVNVPWWDDWQLIPLLAASARGEPYAHLLWAQHNEHRPLLPNLAMLALARWTHWNLWYGFAANWLCAVAAFGILTLMMVRTVGTVAPGMVPVLVVIGSLFTFSLASWINWVWSWQLEVFMSVLATVATAWFTLRWRGDLPGLGCVLAAAVGALLCFASGFALLALLPPALWLAPAVSPRGRALGAGTALLAGIGSATLYLIGYQQPAHHPVLRLATVDPAGLGMFILAYLGASLGQHREAVAIGWGAIGLTAFVACTICLWRRSDRFHRSLLPWVLLGLYAILSGTLTAVGRLGFGVARALSSQYVPISSLFWTSTAAVVTLAIAEASHRPMGRWLRVGVLLFSIAAAHSYRRTWENGRRSMSTHARDLLRARVCLLHADAASEACLRVLFPDPQLVRIGSRQLEALALGPFASPRRR